MSERLKRVVSPELDAILGVPFPILDQGFIRVIDYLGNDTSIETAARNCYGKGTEQVSDIDVLLRYLMRKRHTTPYEFAELVLQIMVPMDCWRQWIRHRTASVNEYSTRYSEAIDDTSMTLPGEWRVQSVTNKQGSGGFVDLETGEHLSQEEQKLIEHVRRVYLERLECGVAREQARKDLTLSTYTRAFWKIDLHNLFHFLGLRMEKHAQKEIRDPATVIGEQIVAKWVPIAWQAFLDYKLNALTLSALDIEMLKAVIEYSGATGAGHPAEQALQEITEVGKKVGWFTESGHPKKKSRELKEFREKADRLDLILPW
jgi:thymidylate synthase (FAD)